MPFTGNKKEAKAFVSALRRELKKLNKPVGELSHNDCLAAVGVAFGHANWNGWEASLPDDPRVAQASAVEAVTEVSRPKYPLVNDGAYDFIAAGQTGVPCEGLSFKPVQGTSDIVLATAPVYTAARSRKDLSLIPDYDDETDVCWDSQEVQKGQDGHALWSTESSGDVSERALVLVPCDEDDDGDSYDMLPQSKWPVRTALVEAYLAFANETADTLKQLTDKAFIAQATKTLGFALTRKESKALVDRLVEVRSAG